MENKCDHGVVFDLETAKKLESGTETTSTQSLESFLAGPPTAYDIRQRWPRLDGPCPKGCGFNGIAYASTAHYIMGDW